MIFILLVLSLLNIFNFSTPNSGGSFVANARQNFIVDLTNLNSVVNKSNNNSKVSDNVNSLNIDVNSIKAKAFLVRELNGDTLLSKNIFVKKNIASITKLMSVYLGFNLFKESDIFTFDQESIDQLGTIGNFVVGERISRNDIFKVSLVGSSNDAIYLLAKTYGLNDFIALMNKTAKEFNMLNTSFTDVTGVGNNLSTAYDLSLLLEKIYTSRPDVLSLSNFEFVVINNKRVWTTNILLPKYKNIIIGSKTGFTPSANECLVALVKFANSPFLAVVILDSDNRFQDFEYLINALKNYYGN
ncbi:MAG: hypothetical protein KatS3mg097_234 [Candidatus Parcubacteria bacterium]|nr:MAG: hypothetical protein KatS3mg097_234 [Candidatus Parcubacteria bacterium]